MKNFTILSTYIRDFFSKGHSRTIAAKRNIVASVIIKGANIAIGLTIIPLTINYLDPTRYGIWVTLSSLVAWFGFFDIGLGQGLRNRFAEALAREEYNKARVYVSTTYAILTIVITTVIVVFLIVNHFLNWNKILNADASIVTGKELSLLATIVFVLFCMSFVLKLITTILTADQKPALASLFDLMGKLLALIVIFVLTKTTAGSLLCIGTVYSFMPVLVLVSSSFCFYNGRYRKYRPSINYVEFSQAPHLLNLGVKFFVIQITGVLLYQTNTIIIAHIFDPSEVTVYNVTYQYFAVFTSVFSIILTPYWSAFTDAYTKNDYSWIKAQVVKLKKVAFTLTFIMLFALFVIQYAFTLWVGDEVTVNFWLSIMIALYIILTTFSSINCQFLNGVGKIKLQLIIAITYSVIHIPVTIYFCTKLGIAGIMISSIFVTLFALVLYEIQYRKIINNKALGIWNA